jgi:HEPN domain-containing protein
MPRNDPRAALARQWLVKAQHDLLLAERARQPPAVLEGITFHAQQTAEKALKGYLAWRNQRFGKTHALPSLVSRCASMEPDFATLLDAAEALDEFIATGRYPDVAVEPTPEAAEESYRLAQQVVAFVLSRLPPEARP